MDQKLVNKILKIIKVVLFLIGIFALVYFASKVAVYFLPIIIAFGISALIEPIVNFIIKKFKLPRKGASLVSVLLILSTVGFLIFLGVSKLSFEISGIINRGTETYITDTYNIFNELFKKGNIIFDQLPVEIKSSVFSIATSLAQSLNSVVTKGLKGFVDTAVSIPEAFIFTVVTILATYFITADRETINIYFRRHLPDSWMDKLHKIKTDAFSALFGYLRAQLIIMTITFSELYIGFSIIGIKYSLVLSIAIAMIDILPVLGTGGVLVPWALYNLLVGNTRLAISLVILYMIVFIVRQFIEPKIVSQQIGLHPLVTLTAMYIGLKLFGFLGMIFGPITVLVLKNVLSGAVKTAYIKELLNKIKFPEDCI